MNPHRLAVVLAATAAAVVGVGFFNTIIGVFGPTAAMIALGLFVALATQVARRRQPED
ncbi:hypothetical protein ACFPOB_25160 [Bosea eneae]|uniref:Uncharacterized protein n=1 Tax=Bosea eneae TaxID=151454 RepID=A0ABW0IWY6_9HYPH